MRSKAILRSGACWLLAGAAAVLLPACWSSEPAPAEPAAPATPVFVPTPKPLDAPAAPAPGGPAPGPKPAAAAASSPAAPGTAAPIVYTNEIVGLVKPGMTKAQVFAVLRTNGEAATHPKTGKPCTKHVDSAGNAAFVMREMGRLVSVMLVMADGTTVLDSAAPKPAKAKPGDDAPAPPTSQELYDAVTKGMGVAEVSKTFGSPEKLVATTAGGVLMYRWTAEDGASFTGRFEEGKLTRKTALSPAAAAGKEAEERAAEAVEEEEEPAGDEAPRAEKGEPAEEEAVYEEEESAGQEDADGTAAPEEAKAASRVRVAGKSAGAEKATAEKAEKRPASNRERRREASLPKFAHGFRSGSYEVRVVNDSGVTVEAGLRQGDRGADFSLSDGGSKSIKVGRGDYRLYFVYSDEAEALQESETVAIDGAYTTDVQLRITGNGARIEALNAAPNRR